MSPTPVAVEPPTRENIRLYRAAALAYRKAWRGERVKGLGANRHVPLRAAALAVWELRKELSYVEAESFAQRAVAWVRRAHNAWLWG
jgi:hypothetical protein